MIRPCTLLIARAEKGRRLRTGRSTMPGRDRPDPAHSGLDPTVMNIAVAVRATRAALRTGLRFPSLLPAGSQRDVGATPHLARECHVVAGTQGKGHR
jgi:hypothetical protein